MMKFVLVAIAAFGLIAGGCKSGECCMKNDAKAAMAAPVKDKCPEACCKDGKCNGSPTGACKCK